MRFGIVVLMTLLAQKPPQPDVSGRWVLDSAAPTDAARVLVVEQPITHITIRGTEMPPRYLHLSIRRERPSGVTDQKVDIGRTGGLVAGPAESRFQNIWRGRTLVMLTSRAGPDGPHTGDWFERRETWSLESDGRLRVEIVSETNDQPQLTTVAFYRREWKPEAGSRKPAAISRR